jgi:hypothetical protein
VFANDAASRAAEDVTDEENVQAGSGSWVGEERELGTEKPCVISVLPDSEFRY